jgi:hypothetical protein
MTGQQKVPRTPPQRKGYHVKVHISDKMQRLLDGTLEFTDLTDEELRRGQLADKNGNFTGKPPDLIPRKFYNAMVRELTYRMNAKFREHALEAIDTVVDVMRNGEGEQFSQFERAGTGRLKAAELILNRVIGKVADKSEVSVDITTWQGLAENGELLIDVEATDLPEEVETKALPSAPTRARGPRTRPTRG